MIKATSILLGFSTLSFSVFSQELQTTQKTFAIELSSSRVIFTGDRKSVSLSVLNPQSYPVLVQSVAYKEDLKTAGSFIITPPLIRLEAQQRSNLSVRLIDASGFANDRESMEWMCVKGVPPKDSHDAPSVPGVPEVVLQVSLNTCNKIFYRPRSVTESPSSFYGNLKWAVRDGHYFVKNDGPFYMNFADVRHNGNPVFGFDYIAPFSEKKFKAATSGTGVMQWKLVTDTGGVSSAYKSSL
ncbi:fimbria/pilus periplasmic chaperone (plasmid) [Enterobacter sp. D2]|uniref:fimbria/pilus periplasmic chaperone n=1 Tax=Enterobacter sp. D2 TaxID=3102784 RepID=UPI002ACA4725|nr:fimbria/pilus periplasmic chaperone [Enterobacter sp. D2]MDZ5731097.1 fimbria/pilus periplasmic chaperone [Enterobacter sp. D2]